MYRLTEINAVCARLICIIDSKELFPVIITHLARNLQLFILFMCISAKFLNASYFLLLQLFCFAYRAASADAICKLTGHTFLLTRLARPPTNRWHRWHAHKFRPSAAAFCYENAAIFPEFSATQRARESKKGGR